MATSSPYFCDRMKHGLSHSLLKRLLIETAENQGDEIRGRLGGAVNDTIGYITAELQRRSQKVVLFKGCWLVHVNTAEIL